MDLKSLPHASAVDAAAERFGQMKKELADLCIQVQQIAAPTGHEKARADWVQAYFERLALADITQDEVYNVYARLPGTGDGGAALLVSAHTDTVFPAETDLSVSWPAPSMVAGPGIGDNSTGVAGLLALADMLVTLPPPPVDIWLVANSNEEGLGDLKGMRAAVDRLQSSTSGMGTSGIGAAIVLEGMGLGRVVHQALGVRRYRIRTKAPGGHSWGDFGSASAIHALVAVAGEIAKMKVPKDPRTSFNIGVIEGGRTVNTIAEDASMDLDLRSVDPEMLERIDRHVQSVVERHRQNHQRYQSGVSFHMEQIGNRPAGEIAMDHPMVTAVSNILRQVDVIERKDIRISSTDANIPLSQGIPAVCVGLTEGGDAHRLSEWIDTEPLWKGMQQLLYLTWWTAAWLTSEGR